MLILGVYVSTMRVAVAGPTVDYSLSQTPSLLTGVYSRLLRDAKYWETFWPFYPPIMSKQAPKTRPVPTRIPGVYKADAVKVSHGIPGAYT